MKNVYFLSICLLIANGVFAQNNILPDSGYVGIGTTNPTANLHIIGSPQDALGNAFIIGATTSCNLRLGYNTNYAWIQSHGSKPLYINELGNDLILNPSYGNVGIGAKNPVVPLHVARSGNNVTGNMTLVTSFTDPTGIKGISLGYNQSSQAGIIYSENNTGIGSPLEFWTYNGSSFASRMIFTQAGNLGIGISNPDVKLSVNGNIRAKEIKVENANWPDYVFTKDYQLPTLQQTENHIKEKGHLPGIPSAAEVKANGIDLGEMNAKLLQKIEELTLHLIEKEKEITNLKQRDQQQEDKINFILSKLNHSNSQK